MQSFQGHSRSDRTDFWHHPNQDGGLLQWSPWARYKWPKPNGVSFTATGPITIESCHPTFFPGHTGPTLNKQKNYNKNNNDGRLTFCHKNFPLGKQIRSFRPGVFFFQKMSPKLVGGFDPSEKHARPIGSFDKKIPKKKKHG